MKIEMNLNNLFNKIDKLLKDILNDSYYYICYNEQSRDFFLSDTHYDDNYPDDDNIIPLQDLLSEIRELPDNKDMATLTTQQINSIISLAVENIFIINECILIPAGHNLLGYKYNNLTSYEYDYEKGTLTLVF